MLKSQMELLEARQPYVALVGGLGSGKSEAGILKAILTMIEVNNIDMKVAAYMPNYSLLSLRTRPGFEIVLTKFGIDFKTNKSSNEIKTPYGTIIMRSYDAPERIVGYEVALSLVDEISTINDDKGRFVMRKISERCRQVLPGVKNQIIITTSPDNGKASFLYEEYGNISDHETYKLIQAKTYDNPYLPKDYIKQIKANYTPELALAFIEGAFVAFSTNRVYDYFDLDKHHKDNSEFETEITRSGILMGADFNIDGSFSCYGVQRGDHVHIFKEMISKDTLTMREKTVRAFPDRWIRAYPDRAGAARSSNAKQTDHQILEDNTMIQVVNQGGNPLISDRINTVNVALFHERLSIDTKACPYLTEALQNHSYDPKTEQPEKFSKHPSYDDANDALGYLAYDVLKIVKPSFGITRY